MGTNSQTTLRSYLLHGEGPGGQVQAGSRQDKSDRWALPGRGLWGLSAGLYLALQHSQTAKSGLDHWSGDDQKPELLALNSPVILALVSMFSFIN